MFQNPENFMKLEEVSHCGGIPAMLLLSSAHPVRF